MEKITILGTGAYGKALAQTLGNNGHQVIMWGIIEQEILDINHHKSNGIILNQNITASNDLKVALENSDIIIFAIPAKSVDSVSKKISIFSKKSILIINATKGFDPITGQRLSVVIKNNLNNSNAKIAGIYGPSLALDVMKNHPTQVCAVSENLEIAQKVKTLFNNNNFSVVVSDDLIGVECFSALKNVIGIIAGILKAQKVSDSTFAAMITIAINEAMLYVTKLGGRLETILTPAGIGDLLLSCALPNSRNYKFGYQIGTTNDSKKIIQDLNTTVEGLLTCKIVYQQKTKLKLSLPLFSLVYQILFENQDPKIIVNFLNNVN